MRNVIVLGAGPAGNMAALRLAERGYDVEVVDWRRELGDKLCTGIIGRDCVERFPPEGGQVYREARSATIVSPAGRRYQVEMEEAQAYVVDRAAYVSSVARRAAEAGARYSLGRRVTAVEVGGDGVTVHTGPGQDRLQAQMVMVATGFGSPVVRMVGLPEHKANDYMVAYQAEVTAEALEHTEVYLGGHVAPGSFGWLVPLGGSNALAGLVSRGRLNGHMERFLSELQRSGKVTGVRCEPRRWGIPVKPLRRTYADRALVLGDTAGLAKPTTGGGIYYALLSGELAAETAGEALQAGDFSVKALRGYEKRWKRAIGGELEFGYLARMLYEAMDDRQVDRLLKETFSDSTRGELFNPKVFSFDRHSRVIIKVLRHARLGRFILSLGPVTAPFVARMLKHAAS